MPVQSISTSIGTVRFLKKNREVWVLEYHSVREMTGMEPPVRMQWEIQPSASSDDRNQMENNLHIFRPNEIYDFHWGEKYYNNAK